MADRDGPRGPARRAGGRGEPGDGGERGEGTGGALGPASGASGARPAPVPAAALGAVDGGGDGGGADRRRVRRVGALRPAPGEHHAGRRGHRRAGAAREGAAAPLEAGGAQHPAGRLRHPCRTGQRPVRCGPGPAFGHRDPAPPRGRPAQRDRHVDTPRPDGGDPLLPSRGRQERTGAHGAVQLRLLLRRNGVHHPDRRAPDADQGRSPHGGGLPGVQADGGRRRRGADLPQAADGRQGRARPAPGGRAHPQRRAVARLRTGPQEPRQRQRHRPDGAPAAVPRRPGGQGAEQRRPAQPGQALPLAGRGHLLADDRPVHRLPHRPLRPRALHAEHPHERGAVPDRSARGVRGGPQS